MNCDYDCPSCDKPWFIFHFTTLDDVCQITEMAPPTRTTSYWLLCGHSERGGLLMHDDVIKWKHFPRNWPFVREIHRSPVNFPHKGQWRGALMFSLIYAWINDWVNNHEAGDLRRQHGHYDVIVMETVTVKQRYDVFREYSCTYKTIRTNTHAQGVLFYVITHSHSLSVYIYIYICVCVCVNLQANN